MIIVNVKRERNQSKQALKVFRKEFDRPGARQRENEIEDKLYKKPSIDKKSASHQGTIAEFKMKQNG